MTTSEKGMQRAEISASALGMILFISSEVMFFAALFGAYFTVRGRAEQWPAGGAEVELLLPAVATAVLVLSSLTIHRADAAAAAGDSARTTRWLTVTTGLGLAFLGSQAYEYSRLGFGLADHSYGTLFYSLTGFHALHVAAGLALIALVLIKNARGHISRDQHGPVKAASYYWHFVDVVWVVLFATLYLLR